MQWKKITAPAGFAIAAAFIGFMVAGDAVAASNQLNEKYDTIAPAHFDTTFATAPSDTIMFGFRADNVSVCVPATSSATVIWIGKGTSLKSNSGGIFGNTRLGRSSFVSTSFTPPASSCYTYYGAPMCVGVVIGGTWTGTVNLSADRVAK